MRCRLKKNLKKSKRFFWTFLLVGLIFSSLLFSVVKADWEISDNWEIGDSWVIAGEEEPEPEIDTYNDLNDPIFRTRSNNAHFGFQEPIYSGTMGADFYFYKIEVTTTQLYLDKSYTSKYYTRYGIYARTPNNTHFTIETWFPTKNSYAELRINSPTSTNIQLGFTSPNLISAYATGAVSYTWFSGNKTLLLTVNSATSTLFRIYATVTESLQNTAPENIGVKINNMEGCGNWVFSETEYYIFNARYFDMDGATDIDTMKVRFSDGNTTIQAKYTQATNVWTLETGSNVARIKTGTTTIDQTRWINVTFPIYFTTSILDALNVDIYLYCSDGDEIDDWELMATDYFNIYNLGAHANYSFTGAAGKTVGGDVFELWAGGQYGADIFDDTFASGTLSGRWTLIQPYNVSDYYVETSTEMSRLDESFNPYSMKIFDIGGTLINHYIAVYTGFREQTGIFYATMWFYMMDGNDYELTIDFSDTTWTTAKTGPSIQFRDFGYITFPNATLGDYQNVTTYTSNTWINITLAINVNTDTYDIYVAGSLEVSGAEFVSAQTQLNRLYIGTVVDDGTTYCWAYIDDIKIWKSSVGGYGGTAEATLTFNNLQHIHTQFAIGIPGGLQKNIVNEGYVEFGFDYCYEDTWITDAVKVRINITALAVGPTYNWWGGEEGGYNWIQLNVSWYQQGTFLKNDVLYTFWEGGPGGLGYGKEEQANYFRVWLDLWYNKVNASTTYGGRVNSYYYGMSSTPTMWWLFVTGQQWGPIGEEKSQSMFFEDLEDGSGNIISCKQIEMTRVKVKVYRTANYDFRYVLRDFDILSFEFAQNEMVGIDTPIFVATKTPEMPQTGFLAALLSGFNNIGNLIVNALGPALLNFWYSFVNFMDSIFTWLGWPNGFSQIVALIASLVGWVSTALSSFVTFLGQAATFIALGFTTVLEYLGGFINSLASVVSWLGWMWDSLYPYWGWVPEVFTKLLPLLFVFFLLWLLSPLLDKGNLHGTRQRIEDTIGLVIKVVMFLLHLVDLLIDTVYRLVEMVPVVE